MKKRENYIQDSFVLMIVLLISFFTSAVPFVCLFLYGILMITMNIRSLSDSERIIPAIQTLLSLIMALAAASPAAFILLCSCRLFKYSQVVLPPLFYLIYALAAFPYAAAEVVLVSMLLFSAAIVIFAAEKLILSYFSALARISHIVSVMAVREMVHKNLNKELIAKNYLADKNARLEERENISRNIHNSVGHTITAAIMTLDAADMLFDKDPGLAREKMNTANERIRESLLSIRHAVRVLDSESRYVYVADLIKELDAVADSFSMDTTIVIRTDCSDISPDLRIPHEHNEFLCGAMQELLSNGVRHGGADRFTVSLSAYHGMICLKVTDNGKSDFSEDNSTFLINNGFGLKKLISYAEKCAGSAKFTNDHGFRAVIKLPVYKEEKHE